MQAADGEAEWPSLFMSVDAGAGSQPTLDLHALLTPQLVSLAQQWAGELVAWEVRHRNNLPSTMVSSISSCDSIPLPEATNADHAMSSDIASAEATAAHDMPRDAEEQYRTAVRGLELISAEGERRTIAAVDAEMVGNDRLVGQLPTAVVSRLALLTAAVDSRVSHGSLGHQELADLAWCVGHYDR